jgi:hypothetical protein
MPERLRGWALGSSGSVRVGSNPTLRIPFFIVAGSRGGVESNSYALHVRHVCRAPSGIRCSETGNRTRVFRVTGGNTSHYTISDDLPL